MWTATPLAWIQYRDNAIKWEGNVDGQMLLILRRHSNGTGVMEVYDDTQEGPFPTYVFGVLYTWEPAHGPSRGGWYSAMYNVYRMQLSSVHTFFKKRASLGTIRYVLGSAARDDGNPQEHVDVDALVKHVWMLLPLQRVNEYMLWRQLHADDTRMNAIRMLPEVLSGSGDVRDCAERGIVPLQNISYYASTDTYTLLPHWLCVGDAAMVQDLHLPTTRVFSQPYASIGFDDSELDVVSAFQFQNQDGGGWGFDPANECASLAPLALGSDPDSGARASRLRLWCSILVMADDIPRNIVPHKDILSNLRTSIGAQKAPEELRSMYREASGPVTRVIAECVCDSGDNDHDSLIGIPVVWPHGLLRDVQGGLVYYSSMVYALLVYKAGTRRVPMFSGREYTQSIDQWVPLSTDAVILVAHGPCSFDCSAVTDDLVYTIQQTTYQNGLVQAVCVWLLYDIIVTHIHVAILMPSGALVLSTVPCTRDDLTRTRDALLDATVYGCNATTALCPSVCQTRLFDGVGEEVVWQVPFLKNEPLKANEPIDLRVNADYTLRVLTHTSAMQPVRMTRSRAASKSDTMDGWFRYIQFPAGCGPDDSVFTRIQEHVHTLDAPRAPEMAPSPVDPTSGNHTPFNAGYTGDEIVISLAGDLSPLHVQDDPDPILLNPLSPPDLLGKPWLPGDDHPRSYPYYSEEAAERAAKEVGQLLLDYTDTGRDTHIMLGYVYTDAQMREHRMYIINAIREGANAVMLRAARNHCMTLRAQLLLQTGDRLAPFLPEIRDDMTYKDVYRWITRTMNVALNDWIANTAPDADRVRGHDATRVAPVPPFTIRSQRILLDDVCINRMRVHIPTLVQEFINPVL